MTARRGPTSSRSARDGASDVAGSRRRNKVSGYVENTDKQRSHDMGSQVDPETAASRWTSPNYSTGNVKLTSTMSSRLLFEGGYSINREYRDSAGAGRDPQGPRSRRNGTRRRSGRCRRGGNARTTAPYHLVHA